MIYRKIENMFKLVESKGITGWLGFWLLFAIPLFPIWLIIYYISMFKNTKNN